jgi:hypothetical protein
MEILLTIVGFLAFFALAYVGQFVLRFVGALLSALLRKLIVIALNEV